MGDSAVSAGFRPFKLEPKTLKPPVTAFQLPDIPLARVLEREATASNTGYGGGVSTSADDSQAWNAVFCEAVLAESLGLADRPTALKGPDGRWQGVVTTATGERRALKTFNAGCLAVSGGARGHLTQGVRVRVSRQYQVRIRCSVCVCMCVCRGTAFPSKQTPMLLAGIYLAVDHCGFSRLLAR